MACFFHRRGARCRGASQHGGARAQPPHSTTHAARITSAGASTGASLSHGPANVGHTTVAKRASVSLDLAHARPAGAQSGSRLMRGAGEPAGERGAVLRRARAAGAAHGERRYPPCAESRCAAVRPCSVFCAHFSGTWHPCAPLCLLCVLGRWHPCDVEQRCALCTACGRVWAPQSMPCAGEGLCFSALHDAAQCVPHPLLDSVAPAVAARVRKAAAAWPALRIAGPIRGMRHRVNHACNEQCACRVVYIVSVIGSFRCDAARACRYIYIIR